MSLYSLMFRKRAVSEKQAFHRGTLVERSVKKQDFHAVREKDQGSEWR